ncbi:YpsA SLOG family protein [Microbulbifer sp. GL-2]|uniref:YpsA SLOG family protein n=1 Tax=Microbulbifer sp. GL-2 TaxID=2591606 RepID=UPI001161F441|nr:putative molybdenum carrier protein [Microbulbifer sp. GL-2]BBM03992.1 hypothetical protein GL2_40660 [Microbulbifer sp. GL-2]
MFWPKIIISGGQTGADTGGLVGARLVGIKTGGCAPLGYLTEDGANPKILKSFGLVEHCSARYEDRTLHNIKNSDATLIFATDLSVDGTLLTLRYCQALEKPYLLVDLSSNCVLKIREFLNIVKPNVLNVAGNRESASKGLANRTAEIIQQVFH